MAVEESEGSAEEHGCALWPEDFGERLQRLIEMADLPRRDLADLLGVRESTVQKWLKGGEPTGGNYWGLMQVAIRVPGGFPLLLYGDPCAKVGAEE